MLKADVFDAADSKGLAYVTMACLGRFYLIIRDAATRPRRSVNPNESLSAKFTAPAQNSRYRYVCVCVCATTVLFSALVHWPALWGSGGLRWNKRERERERKRRERGTSSICRGRNARKELVYGRGRELTPTCACMSVYIEQRSKTVLRTRLLFIIFIRPSGDKRFFFLPCLQFSKNVTLPYPVVSLASRTATISCKQRRCFIKVISYDTFQSDW
jgi:hypothetical protein